MLFANNKQTKKITKTAFNIYIVFKMLNLFHNDSMGMLSRQRMIENDSDGVLIRNLVNKLILIKKKIK